jgi:hypothetical protein
VSHPRRHLLSSRKLHDVEGSTITNNLEELVASTGRVYAALGLKIETLIPPELW